jgi:hypothetical protein
MSDFLKTFRKVGGHGFLALWGGKREPGDSRAADFSPGRSRRVFKNSISPALCESIDYLIKA